MYNYIYDIYAKVKVAGHRLDILLLLVINISKGESKHIRYWSTQVSDSGLYMNVVKKLIICKFALVLSTTQDSYNFFKACVLF